MRLLFLLSVGVGLVWWLEAARRRRAYYEGPHYREQIAVLAPTEDEAMKLPAVPPLTGRVVEPHQVNILNFIGHDKRRA